MPRFSLFQCLRTLILTVTLFFTHHAVGDQTSPFSPDETGLPYIKTTTTGSTLRFGNQLYYFEGLSYDEAQWVLDSFIYGGVVPALLRQVAAYGVKHLMADQNLAPLSIPITIISGLFSEGSYWYYTSANMHKIWNTGAWYTVPVIFRNIFRSASSHRTPGSAAPSGEQRLAGGLFNLLISYALMAGSSSLGYMRDMVIQSVNKNNTQYIHVPLSGNSSKYFMVKAVFHDDSGQPWYELNRTALAPPSASWGAFGDLSTALGEINVDRINIQPSQAEDQSTVVSYFYDPSQEKVITLELQADFGSNSDAPWLLDRIYHKADRSQVRNIRSALSPRVIQAFADAYHAYSNRFLCKKIHSEEKCAMLWESAPGTYTYEPGYEIVAQPSKVMAKPAHTDFEFISSNGETVNLKWTDGTFWPGLTMRSEESESEMPMRQWLIPEWFTKFLVAELAIQFRELGRSATDYAAKNVINALPQPEPGSPARSGNTTRGVYSWILQLLSGEDPYQVAIDVSNSTEPASDIRLANPLADFPDSQSEKCLICLEKNHSLGMLPCCSKAIHEDCLLRWGRERAGRERFIIQRSTRFPRFDFICPHCRQRSIPADIVKW